MIKDWVSKEDNLHKKLSNFEFQGYTYMFNNRIAYYWLDLATHYVHVSTRRLSTSESSL